VQRARKKAGKTGEKEKTNRLDSIKKRVQTGRCATVPSGTPDGEKKKGEPTKWGQRAVKKV